MWAIATAAALTYGLIRAAVAEPARKRRSLERRLEGLSSRDPASLTLDEAEDGLALGRRLGKRTHEAAFRGRVSVLKQQRSV